MTGHLTEQDTQRLLRGDLSGEAARAVFRHLEECPRCAAAARSSDSVARAGHALAAEIAFDSEHPPVETLLTAYVDGTLDREELDAVQAHIDGCRRCREDAADLRAAASTLQQPRRSWIAAAAAAAAAVAIIATTLLIRKEHAVRPAPPVSETVTQTTAPAPPAETPAPAPAPVHAYARPEWRAAVAEALRDGAIAMPAALADLQVRPDQERAPSDRVTARLEPTGVILDATRPRFRWTATQGATYLVSVFDEGALVMESPELSEATWRPDRALARGRPYQWQVEVRLDATRVILPAPPAPPALFRVLDARAHEELEHARATHAGEPLLLGVLYARNGLRAEAERELRRVDTEDGRRLLRSVEEWSR